MLNGMVVMLQKGTEHFLAIRRTNKKGGMYNDGEHEEVYGSTV